MLALGTSKPGEELKRKPREVKAALSGAIIHVLTCALGLPLCHCSGPQLPHPQNGDDGER